MLGVSVFNPHGGCVNFDNESCNLNIYQEFGDLISNNIHSSLPLVDSVFVEDEAGQEEGDGEQVEHEDPQRGEEAEVAHDWHDLKRRGRDLPQDLITSHQYYRQADPSPLGPRLG